MVEETNPGASAAEDDGWTWAIVEIMGHRRHAGRIREEVRFGAPMLRVDVPTKHDGAAGWETHWYGGAAIFCITPTTMDAVCKLTREPEPVGLLSYDDRGVGIEFW